MILTYTKRPARAYALAAAVLGVAALAVSLPASALLLWDARYLMLAFCALTVGTRLYVKVPHAASAVPASAAFVLLAALIYGFGAAVPLAAAAAVVSSLRLSRRGASLLYDAAPAAVATLLTGWCAHWLGLLSPKAPAFAAAFAALLFSFLQSAFGSAQLTAFGRGGKARSALRAFLDALAWTFTAYLVTSTFSVLAAQVPAGFALDAFLAVASAAAAADALYHAHRGNSAERKRPGHRGRSWPLFDTARAPFAR